MFRNDDPQKPEAVRRAFEGIARNRDLPEIYHKWFARQPPTGERIGLAMNAQRSEIFRTLGVEDWRHWRVGSEPTPLTGLRASPCRYCRLAFRFMGREKVAGRAHA